MLKETTRTSTDSWSLRQAIASMPGGGVGTSSVASGPACRGLPSRALAGAVVGVPSADGQRGLDGDRRGRGRGVDPLGQVVAAAAVDDDEGGDHAEHEHQQHRAHQLLPSRHAEKCARPRCLRPPVAFRAPRRAAYP